MRAVSQVEKRLREAARQGFEKAVISKHNAAKLPKDLGLKVVSVSNVNEAILAALKPAKQ